MLIEKKKPISAPAHLAFVRTLPCVVCATVPSQAAHVRFGGDGGMGMKPSDSRVVPLCAAHHGQQHAMPERDFWGVHDIDPVELANELMEVSGDHVMGEEVIRQARW